MEDESLYFKMIWILKSDSSSMTMTMKMIHLGSYNLDFEPCPTKKNIDDI